MTLCQPDSAQTGTYVSSLTYGTYKKRLIIVSLVGSKRVGQGNGSVVKGGLRFR